MEMLQPGDELGFVLEPANKLWPVCQPGQDDLYRHLSPQRSLVSSIHSAESAAAYPIEKLIPFDRLTCLIGHTTLPIMITPTG